VREENEIGDNVSIGSIVLVEHHVVIKDGVRLIAGCLCRSFRFWMRAVGLGTCVFDKCKVSFEEE